MDRVIKYMIANDHLEKVVWTVVVIIVAIIANKLINRVLFRAVKDSKKYYTSKKRTNYTVMVIAIIAIVFTWVDTDVDFSTYIGLLSAGIAIALKEVFSNMAAWLFISIAKPFEVGHRVLIGEQRGDVIDIRIFQFSMIEISEFEDGEQSTGRIIDVPNHFVFTYPLVNYTKGFEYIWNEIKVLVTFESDWRRAKTLLLDIVEKDSESLLLRAKAEIDQASKKYMLHYNKLTPIVYTDVKDSGVQLTIRYLCTPKGRRNSINTIWTDIMDMIESEAKIDLAYPTRRVVND